MTINLKVFRYSLYILSIITLVGAFWLYKSFLIQPSKEVAVPKSSINNFSQSLQDEYQEIQKQLSSLGVTEQKLAEMHHKYYKKYLQSDIPDNNQKISLETEQFVQNVLKRYGLEPKKISIVPWNQLSPAAATQRVIYVNEKTFSELSDRAKLFVVGHEIQHIVHQDNPTNSFINHLLGISAENLADNGKFDHPLCRYSRFIEKRADIETALKGKEWAQGYLAFAQERLQKYGDEPNGTHPRRSERVALAQQILDYHNQIQIV